MIEQCDEDLKISQPQKVLASAGSAIAQSTQLLLKARIENKAVDVEELIRMNADSLALLGHVSGDLAQLRRDNIRPGGKHGVVGDVGDVGENLGDVGENLGLKLE